MLVKAPAAPVLPQGEFGSLVSAFSSVPFPLSLPSSDRCSDWRFSAPSPSLALPGTRLPSHTVGRFPRSGGVRQRPCPSLGSSQWHRARTSHFPKAPSSTLLSLHLLLVPTTDHITLFTQSVSWSLILVSRSTIHTLPASPIRTPSSDSLVALS